MHADHKPPIAVEVEQVIRGGANLQPVKGGTLAKGAIHKSVATSELVGARTGTEVAALP